jgi:1,5-anhydro-D-fructose reductase (1,5-anhydro-D-mannitol-forming)
VLSRDAGLAADFARRHGAAAPQPAHTSLPELLADPALHAVIVTTPDGLHAEQSVAAARAGKHVLVEKPLATELEGARAILTACRENDVRCGVAYHLRWHEGHRRLVDAVHAGRFGTVRHVRAQWTWRAVDDRNWRAQPDVGRWWGLAGVGTHCLDLARWILTPEHGEVESMQSTISRSVWGGPHDETAILSMQFSSGTTAEICTSVLFESPTRLEVYGSDGWAIGEQTLGPAGAGVIHTHHGPLKFPVRNPYVGEIEDFVTAIQVGRDPEVPAAEGLRNVELLLAADPGES